MKSHCLNSGRAKQKHGARIVIRKWLLLAAIALITLSSTRLVYGQGGVFYIVNTTSDTVVIGACQNGDAGCSLRGAIGTANAHLGADGIGFNLPAGSVINLTGVLPDLTEDVSISGPGPDQLTVRRDTGGDYRIFKVTTTGAVTFSGMTISNGLSGDINSNDVDGGGIMNLNGGTVNVTSCTISGNSAGGQVGGGIYNQNNGTVNVTNSTIRDNGANFNGGGIYNTGGIINVTGSTISGNSASAMSATGGGIFNGNTNLNFGRVNVTNSTIAHNFASFTAGTGEGGGIRNEDGMVNVKSSIIALNVALSFLGQDVRGIFTTGGFNLIGDTNGGGGFDAPTDQTGTTAAPLDPKLDPNGLQDNGGLTETIALLFGSPTIDKGSSEFQPGLFLITDQRGTGFPRAFDDPLIVNAEGGDGTDIGAFELQTGTPATLGNISTRLRVETGDNVLIGGFIITGTLPKKVMLRAIGPSLPLAGALANPILELRNGAGTLVARNDNWMNASNRQEIIDSTIAPAKDLESAILRSLDPGSYTAIVSGVNNSTGIGLVEAFDLDLGADSILANISTRGLVQTGDDVMIGGIIILGTDAQQVLLRAIGPSLPVAGKLADPTLELHDKDGSTIASNDDWRSDQEADIIATTIPPTKDAESAILMTLTPDAYTAIVRGKDNTTGIALVEAYQLDN